MKAVGYRSPGPIERDDALVDVEIDRPSPSGHDLLVQVKAVSVNPVDCKIRATRQADGDVLAILGWDAVGEVVDIGDAVSAYKPGDAVWYAGAINRSGSNSEFHLVDERIAGSKPASASDAEAAALPLTTLTAWEMLFDRLQVDVPVPGAAPAVVIIGGVGGVGSIAIQLLRARTDLTVIATASRPETTAWVRELGAHHVVNHRDPLTPQIEALGIGAPAFVFSTNFTESYVEQINELIAPQGRFGFIDDPKEFDIMTFKFKSVSVHMEFMFTRSLFGTEDMSAQRDILNEVATLLDAGKIRSTHAESFGIISAANLKKAHSLLETGTAKGKIVLEGF